MEAGVMRPEMLGEPAVQTGRQLRGGALAIGLVAVHDVADFLEQLLVRLLVRVELVVAALAHEALLEREMRRHGPEDLPQKACHVGLGALFEQALVQFVDELDQLAVLVIDCRDADAVAFLPCDQGHALPPFSR
jgi:hypothetical protein